MSEPERFVFQDADTNVTAAAGYDVTARTLLGRRDGIRCCPRADIVRLCACVMFTFCAFILPVGITSAEPGEKKKVSSLGSLRPDLGAVSDSGGGACCLGEGECVVTGADECEQLGGLSEQPGTDCAACAHRVFWIRPGDDPAIAGFDGLVIDASELRGGEITLEIWLEHVPDRVRGVRAALSCRVAGKGGTVEVVNVVAEYSAHKTDWFCFGYACSISARFGDCPEGNASIAVAPNVGGVRVTAPKYVGDVTFAVSADAQGVFGFPFENLNGDPSDFANTTLLLDEDGNLIPGLTGTPLIFATEVGPGGRCGGGNPCRDDDVCTFDSCTYTFCNNSSAHRGDMAGPGGKCGPDGEIDLFDIFAVLDAFGGVYTPGCEPHNFDFAGRTQTCTPDGKTNLFDIFAVLDAFQSIDPCCIAP